MAACCCRIASTLACRSALPTPTSDALAAAADDDDDADGAAAGGGVAGGAAGVGARLYPAPTGAGGGGAT